MPVSDGRVRPAGASSSATEQTELATTWSVSFRELVCGRMEAAAVGAQTERPGVAGPVRGLLWRQNLTGRFRSLFRSEFATGPRGQRDGRFKTSGPGRLNG